MASGFSGFEIISPTSEVSMPTDIPKNTLLEMKQNSLYTILHLLPVIYGMSTHLTINMCMIYTKRGHVLCSSILKCFLLLWKMYNHLWLFEIQGNYLYYLDIWIIVIIGSYLVRIMIHFRWGDSWSIVEFSLPAGASGTLSNMNS